MDEKQTDEGGWTVRAVDRMDRKMAVAAAKRANQPVGIWLSEAIRAYVAGERQEPQTGIIVSPRQEIVPAPAEVPSRLTIGEIDLAVQAMCRIAQIRGKPLKSGSRVLVAAERAIASRLKESVL